MLRVELPLVGVVVALGRSGARIKAEDVFPEIDNVHRLAVLMRPIPVGAHYIDVEP